MKRVQGVALTFKFPRSQFDQVSGGCARTTSLIRCSSTSQFTGLKGSTSNVLLPDNFRGLVEFMPPWVRAVLEA